MQRAHDELNRAAIGSSRPVSVWRATRRTERNRRATMHSRRRRIRSGAKLRQTPTSESHARLQTTAASSDGKRDRSQPDSKCRAKYRAARINPSLVRKAFQTEQEGISGKSRSRRVGRISVAERTKRQNLPNALAGRREEIHEAIRSRTKIPHTAARGKRRRMEQEVPEARGNDM